LGPNPAMCAVPLTGVLRQLSAPLATLGKFHLRRLWGAVPSPHPVQYQWRVWDHGRVQRQGEGAGFWGDRTVAGGWINRRRSIDPIIVTSCAHSLFHQFTLRLLL